MARASTSRKSSACATASQGATVNDVAIAIVAGGLRRYLDARLEPPAASLVAEAPIASRSATRVFGTRTFADSAIMSLHTDCEDPAERLRRIAAQTHRLARESGAASSRRLMQDLMEFVPALALGMAGEAAQRVRLGSLFSPIANTTIASLRGPDVPLYMAGATLVGYYGFPPVHDLAGLAHTVGYYNGAMTIGVAACRTMLPDPARYAQCLRDAYAELGDALGVRLAGRAPPGARGARDRARPRAAHAPRAAAAGDARPLEARSRRRGVKRASRTADNQQRMQWNSFRDRTASFSTPSAATSTTTSRRSASTTRRPRRAARSASRTSWPISAAAST